jgi:penicillin-binding protein 2
MRLKIVLYFIVLIVLVLLSRVYFLSIKSNSYYEELAKRNYIKKIYIAPSRGIIKDRNGIPLAINSLGFSVSIKPHLRNKQNYQRLVVICKLLQQNFAQFNSDDLIKKYKRLDSPYRHNFVKIIDYIPYDIFFPKYPLLNSYDDIKIEASSKRFYPFNEVAGHILGYVGKANRKNIKENPMARYTGIVGKSGLEKYYNDKLQGKLGYKILKVNALNQQIEILKEVKPVVDNDIQISIDIKLQQYINKLFGKRSGVVIVMDVYTGELLAAGSYPEFDNNIFVNGISHKKWKKIINDFDHPFTNKIINGLYPPGSVIKMGTALSFLENGVSKYWSTVCTGGIQLGKRKFRCWNHGGHGNTGFSKAIRESCDVFFYEGSLKVGINNIHKTLDKLGFGKKTGIDQVSESYGVNPNKLWKQGKYKLPWYIGETVVSAIGQGFILVTPIQIARYTGYLATGKLPRPHFINDASFNKPIDTHIDPKKLKFIRKGMYQVCNHPAGTAYRHIRTSIKIAGKTGTAQVVGISQSEKVRMKEHELEYYHRSHAWLTTYGPFKNPKYAVTVLVEHGGHGGSAAGGIVSKIYNKLIELGYIKK